MSQPTVPTPPSNDFGSNSLNVDTVIGDDRGGTILLPADPEILAQHLAECRKLERRSAGRGRPDQARHDAENAQTLYNIERHQHLFAAWAASRAASVKGCRFKVKQGREILEASGFTPAFSLPDQLPVPEKMDEQHRQWRSAIIKAAQTHNLEFTHGVAAKLVNCYLKSRFICGGHHKDVRVYHLHPPIDDELLKALIQLDIGGHGTHWRRLRRQRWSRFTLEQYEEAVALIRQFLNGEPLWKIEEYWKGNQ